MMNMTKLICSVRGYCNIAAEFLLLIKAINLNVFSMLLQRGRWGSLQQWPILGFLKGLEIDF